ncbi:MAG TPA: ABC transporter substrate-binding protein [Burkholderiales bacterium]|nr:ABC transporter substrate-binding protein [Burkholderiales bacterium]
MMKRIVAALFVIAVSFPAFAEKLPDQIAHEVTDKIIALIKTNRDAYAKDYRKLYQMVDENILPHFDFRKIAQQVLGPAWRNASPEQREKFTKEFRDLMVRTYGTALIKYTDEEIVYLPLKIPPGDRTAVVRSQIRRSGAPSIAINYNFYKPDAEWKVYDMAIEGPSIVTTYQRVYAERLRKQDIDQLIAGMAQDNQRAAVGGAGASK